MNIKDIKELLQEVDEYLSQPTYQHGKPTYLNTIGGNSILHKKVKQALAEPEITPTDGWKEKLNAEVEYRFSEFVENSEQELFFKDGAQWAVENITPAPPANCYQWVKEVYVWTPMDGCLEEMDSFEEAKKYIKDNYMEDGQVHPDIESIGIFQKIGGVSVTEIGGTAEIDGEEVPNVKVEIDLDLQPIQEAKNDKK
jgi:hypothetical protein